MLRFYDLLLSFVLSLSMNLISFYIVWWFDRYAIASCLGLSLCYLVLWYVYLILFMRWKKFTMGFIFETTIIYGFNKCHLYLFYFDRSNIIFKVFFSCIIEINNRNETDFLLNFVFYFIIKLTYRYWFVFSLLFLDFFFIY